MSKTVTPFSNIGIESISHESGATNRLPDSMHVVPSDTPRPEGQLDALYAPRLQEDMQSFLRPSIASRDILRPSVFNQKLGRAAESLLTAADEKKSRNLRHAARILQDDAELKSLLLTYRGLLQKG